MSEKAETNYLPWIAVAVLGYLLWSNQTKVEPVNPTPKPVVVDARKLTHDTAVAMVRRMGDDIEKVAKSDAKTVLEAAEISVKLDEATRDEFKKNVGEFMSKALGNDELPDTAEKFFLDMAAGFRSVK